MWRLINRKNQALFPVYQSFLCPFLTFFTRTHDSKLGYAKTGDGFIKKESQLSIVVGHLIKMMSLDAFVLVSLLQNTAPWNAIETCG